MNNISEDIELSKEDIEFFKEHEQFIGFLTKSEDSDTEQIYEKTPRSNKSWIPKEPTKLPIKLPDGKIKHQETNNDSNNENEEKDEISSLDSDNYDENLQDDMKIDKSDENYVASSNNDIIQKKEELAIIAQTITEDPENNIGQLKILREIATNNNLTIKKLALLTQLVVYKDIIPGYRIRQLTDKEKATKVSEEVKKLRHFEQSLVSNYQAYLKSLETELKEHAIAETALKCMCDLLMSVTHFNFRSNLMMTIVSRTSTVEFTKMSAMCCEAIIEVFKNDESGEASLDAIKLITKMIKSKGYVVHEEILNTFLHLRLKEELSIKASNNESSINNQAKGKKRKYDKQKPKKHLSKKLKKLDKKRKEVVKEMKEANAVVDKEEREKRHTETLKLVFITYFRILKHANSSPLLISALEGLVKLFAHLINVEFFNDLLELLKKIMITPQTEDDNGNSSRRVDTRISLLCIITAFQLLSGEALNIDLKDFYTQMYKILMPLALNPYMELNENIRKRRTIADNNKDEIRYSNNISVSSEQQLLMEGFDYMFFKKRTIPIERSAAFLKRLSISCLNWPSKTVLICLEKMQKMIQKQSRLDALLISDDRICNGVYRADLDDPELCNPLTTNLWELSLLESHYDPKVRAMATSLATFVPNGERPL
ncbi:5954_t:CDS:10 [Dentiscutata erythropus]|uniref:Nucleolar complex-associated protein 3 n=1 Tax=Dentiscutata erythropus TaxID=1348616 RepID=A0A9N8ZV93_9GLOM|nr:5954_t:CDS:10 [Dentiscutata erythropus]